MSEVESCMKAKLVAEILEEKLVAYIRQQGLKPGDRLPSEAAMAEQMEVSRTSVREAYVRLIDRGIINRKHGFGTFVGNTIIQDDQNRRRTFGEAIGLAGLSPSCEVLRAGHVAAGREMAVRLGCKPTNATYNMLRVFRADGHAAVLIEDFIAPHLDVSKADFVEHASDYVAALAKIVDLDGAILETETTAIAARPLQSDHFSIPLGEPILMTRSSIRHRRGKVLTASRVWLNPNLLSLTSTRNLMTAPILSLAGGE